MDSQPRSFRVYGLILLSLLVLAGLGWVNYRYAVQNMGGRSFMIYWVGARALIVGGDNPYSEEVASDIQAAIRERSVEPPQFHRFIAPVYSIFLFLPFALFSDFALAQALWMLFLEISLGLLVLACLRLTKWRPNTWNIPLFILFAFTWIHSLVALQEGSDVIVVALLLAWVFLAIHNGQNELAGILLALSTIHPLVVILPLAFVLLWAGFHGRWKLVVWFAGFLIVLIFLGLFFKQDWLLQNARAAIATLRTVPPVTPGAAFAAWWPGVGSRLGWILTALVSLVLLLEWWLAFRSKEFRWFFWTACLTLTLGQWTGIRTETVNIFLLLIPLSLVLAVLDERSRRTVGPLGTLVVSVASLLFLSLGGWAITLWGAGQGLEFHELVVLLFPLPLFLMITLYWVRWWAIRPPRLYVEALQEQETLPG